SFRCLDDQHTKTQSADDAVAIREVIFKRRRAERKLRNETAAVIQDLSNEPSIFLWIYGVNACAHHGDRSAFSSDCSAVRSGVYPTGEARNYSNSSRREIARQHF